MTNHRTAFLSLLVVLAAFITPVHAQDEASDAEAEKAKPAGPTLTLLEPGAEPRATLRFRPEKGDTTEVEMVTRMHMKQSMNGVAMPPQKIPPMRMVMAVAIDEVAANGDITFTSTFTDTDVLDEPGVMPMVRQQMIGALRVMEGATVRYLMTDRGIMSDTKFELPPGINPMTAQQLTSMADSIEQFSTPLPEEPVGVGAKWHTTAVTTQNGMTLRQITTYTLTSLEDGKVQMQVQSQLDADPQDLENPMLPPGATMRLVSMDGETEGAITLTLGQVLPTRAEMKASSTTDIMLNMAGQAQEIRQDMAMEMRLRPHEKKAEPGREE